jgi:thiamine biosynthesis lipoprotein
MGTEIDVVGPPEAASFRRVAAAIQGLFERLESRFSRFREDSELSRVNRAAGQWVTVSEVFAELLRISLDGARRSAGLFDPTLLRPLVAAGYDRDFREISGPDRGRGRYRMPDVRLRSRTGRWADVRLDGDRLLVPSGTWLDLGGIGKGWAVDLACNLAGELPWAIVNAGGDLRVVGSPPSCGVDVAVDDPEVPGAAILGMRLETGSLATSSVNFRRWSRAGRLAHHIIDPRTGEPADTGVLQATAWAPDCAEAEIRAKWALLAGPPIVGHLPVALFMNDGRVLVSLGEFAAGEGDAVSTVM